MMDMYLKGEAMGKHIEWADLVLFLTDVEFLNKSELRNWASLFHTVTVAAPCASPGDLEDPILWHRYEEGENYADVWNHLASKAEAQWVLFVQDDERISFNDFPSEEDLSETHWSPALIIHDRDEKREQYYQLRLVPQNNDKVFDGKNLPDATRFVTKQEISLSNIPIVIERGSSPVAHINPAEELTMKSYSPQLYLVQGLQYFREGKYVHAAAQYRQLLKFDKLLPFDRLAAVNGLASCMAEQYKWPQALSLAEKSIEAEPFQGLPYLIKFRISQLNKQWDEALKALKTYFDRIDLFSRASFDVAITKEETLLNLAELAKKTGNKEQASVYLEELFELKNGDVDYSFLRQLLVLSLELNDYDKSVFFFNKMFADLIPFELSEEENDEMNDYMSLFIKKGWYDFVYEIYNELYYENPEDAEYKRRLIVALVKTERVEQARELASKVAVA